MRRLVSWLVGVAIVLGLIVTQAAPAYACSIAPSFVVTAEHLAPGDFNESDSQLASDFREWTGDDSATIEVLGVYVYETIAAVEAEGDYSRGSVSVPVEMWGEWPADTSPRAISPQDRSGEPPDNCGWGASGRPMGTRSYSMVSTAPSWALVEINMSDDDRSVLVDGFGAAAIADRDLDLEQTLIAQIQRSRGSSTALFVGLGVVAIGAAAAVMYVARRASTTTSPLADQ